MLTSCCQSPAAGLLVSSRATAHAAALQCRQLPQPGAALLRPFGAGRAAGAPGLFSARPHERRWMRLRRRVGRPQAALGAAEALEALPHELRHAHGAVAAGAHPHRQHKTQTGGRAGEQRLQCRRAKARSSFWIRGGALHADTGRKQDVYMLSCSVLTSPPMVWSPLDPGSRHNVPPLGHARLLAVHNGFSPALSRIPCKYGRIQHHLQRLRLHQPAFTPIHNDRRSTGGMRGTTTMPGHICIHDVMLHYITLHYITLHYIILYYIILYYIILYYIILYYTILYYTILYYIILYYIILYYIILYYIILYYIILYYIILYYIILYYIITLYLCYIILYYIILD